MNRTCRQRFYRPADGSRRYRIRRLVILAARSDQGRDLPLRSERDIGQVDRYNDFDGRRAAIVESRSDRALRIVDADEDILPPEAKCAYIPHSNTGRDVDEEPFEQIGRASGRERVNGEVSW